MNVILKFVFKKRTKYIFERKAHQKYTKKTQFCMQQLHFLIKQRQTRASRGPITHPLKYRDFRWGKKYQEKGSLGKITVSHEGIFWRQNTKKLGVFSQGWVSKIVLKLLHLGKICHPQNRVNRALHNALTNLGIWKLNPQ